MKDESSRAGSTQMEESKQGGGMDIHRDFLSGEFNDWYKSIWEDFSKIDQDIDRRFRNFSDFMSKNQQKQLESFRREMDQRPALTSGSETGK